MNNRTTFRALRQNLPLPLLALVLASGTYALACGSKDSGGSSSGDSSSSSSSSGASGSSSSSGASGKTSSSSSGTSGEPEDGGGSSSSSSGASSSSSSSGTTDDGGLLADGGDGCTNAVRSDGGATTTTAATFTDIGSNKVQVKLCGKNLGAGQDDNFTFTTPATVSAYNGSSFYNGGAITAAATQNGTAFNLSGGNIAPNAAWVIKITSAGATTSYSYTFTVTK